MARKDGKPDGRRNNRTPDHGKIAPGEVRNPNGAGGKADKIGPTPLQQHVIAMAARVVSQDGRGPATMAERLVQEELHAALVDKNQRARESSLKRIVASELAQLQQERQALEWFFAVKEKYNHLFWIAEKRSEAPPDVEHPDHFNIDNGELVQTGPIGLADRKKWEHIKQLVTLSAWEHQRARRRVQADPSAENVAALKEVEKKRRRYMRVVPRGWNWREEIYSRHSGTKFVLETIAKLEALDEEAS